MRPISIRSLPESDIILKTFETITLSVQIKFWKNFIWISLAFKVQMKFFQSCRVLAAVERGSRLFSCDLVNLESTLSIWSIASLFLALRRSRNAKNKTLRTEKSVDIRYNNCPTIFFGIVWNFFLKIWTLGVVGFKKICRGGLSAISGIHLYAFWV